MLPADPAHCAVATWNALVADHGGRTLLRRSCLHERGSRRQIALWPYSQVMHARSLIQALAADQPGELVPPVDLAPMLRRYSSGPAFTDRPGGRHRYLDDNAWVALAQLQHRRLLTPGVEPSQEAMSLLAWLAEHVDAAGGVIWREGLASRHACSTGAVGLALAMGGAPGSRAHDAARRCSDFLRTVLADDGGLVLDNIAANGVVEQTRWVYNQALLVRLDTALAGLEGDPHAHAPAFASAIGGVTALARADEALSAGLDFFDADSLWRQPIAFVAIWVRAVVARQAVGDDGEVVNRGIQSVAVYTDRLNEHLTVRDGRIGSADDIGRYEAGQSDVLDRAAAVQILALAAMPTTRRSTVV